MVPMMVAGGALMGLGTAANLYGTHQRDKAAKAAMEAYQQAVAAKVEADRKRMGEQEQFAYGQGMDRQRGVGRYLTDLQYAQYPQTDEGFMQRQGGALTDIKNLTKGMDGTYAYEGTPRTQAEGVQTGLTADSNKRAAEGMLREYTDRQIDEREKGAGYRMSLGDLMRGVRGSDYNQIQAKAQALAELDWQKQQAALQGQMDDAQRKGQWLNILGGLGTQLGGMGLMYGMSQMAPAGAVAPGTGIDSGYNMPSQAFDPAMAGPLETSFVP